MSLSENVRRLRAEHFLSQSELAAKAGVTKITIVRVERGDYLPHPRTLRRIAEALGVQPAELIPPDQLLDRQGKAAA